MVEVVRVVELVVNDEDVDVVVPVVVVEEVLL